MKQFVRGVLLAGILVIGSGTSFATPRIVPAFRTAPQVGGTCTTAGSPVTSFSSAAVAAWLSLEISDAKVGDQISVDWVDPRGGHHQSAQDFQPLTMSGTVCLSASLDIAGTKVAKLPGKWTARVTHNGSNLSSLPFTITPQVTCLFAVNPLTISATAAGGPGTISVAASDMSCTWTATSNNTSVVTITSNPPAMGGGMVSYSVSPNNTSSVRTATITVAGQTVTLSQAAGTSCAYALNPSTNSVSGSAGTGSFTVSTAAGCSWTAVSNASFLTVTAGGSGSGPGPTTVNYSYAANTGQSRSGTISVGGQMFTLNQGANPVAPGGAVIGYGPGTGAYTLNRIEVTRSYGGSNVGDGGFTSANNIISPGLMTYPANTTSFQGGWDFPWGGTPPPNRNRYVATVNVTNLPQSVTPTVNATLAATVTVDWNASGYGIGRSHTYQVDDTYHGAQQSPLAGTPGPEDGVGSSSVNANYTKPAPAALNGEVRLILITTFNFGEGAGTGRMEIDFVYTGCAGSITAPAQQPAAGGGTLLVPVSATSGCTWAANVLAGSSWLTASPASGNGSGTVTLTAAPNSGGSYRGGVVNIAGQLLAVTQAAAGGSGSYTFNRIEVTRTYDGSVSGPGSNPIQAGKQTFQGTALLLSYQAGWDGLRPSGGDLLFAAMDRNRFVSFLNFDGVPTAVTPGSNATVTMDMTGDWVAQGYGNNRLHSLSATGAAMGQAQTSTDNPDGTGPLTFNATGPATMVPQPDSKGEVRLVVNGRLDFSDAGGVSIEADLVYTGGGGTGPSNCTFSLASSTGSVAQGGGTGSFSFTASDPSCAWTASSNQAFLTITSATSGTGNGTISYSVTANTTSSTRSATITVGSNPPTSPSNNQTFTVTQPGLTACTFTLNPTSAPAPPTGGTGSFTITPSPSSCAWTTSASSFITITSGGSGTGNGTVNYSVQPDTGAARTGTITVNASGTSSGQATFTVNQGTSQITLGQPFFVDGRDNIWAAGRATAFSGLLPPFYRFSPGPGQVLTVSNVTGTASCSPQPGVCPPASGPDGVMGTGGFSGGGLNAYQGISGLLDRSSGYMMVGVFLDDNTPSGTAPESLDFTNAGFTRINPKVGQVFFVGDGLSGTGTGTQQQFFVPPTATRIFLGLADGEGNPGDYDDNTGGFNVTMNVNPGGPPCSYSLNPNPDNVSAAGGAQSVTVNTQTGCFWSSTVKDNFITVNPNASSNSTGPMPFSVAANTGTTSRTGSVLIADQTLSVVQGSPGSGSSCTFTLSSSSATLPQGGGSGTFSFTASDQTCAWTVSATSFPTITSATSGAGNGSVSFSAPANTSANTLNGMIRLVATSNPTNVQTFTVTQPGITASCTFTLTPPSAQVGAGGTGFGHLTFQVTASVSSCTWTPVSNMSWVRPTGGSPGPGNGSVDFVVDPNTGPARSGSISIGSQTFTVNQAAAAPPCTFSLASTTASAPAGGTSGSVGFTASDNSCPWSYSSNTSWIIPTGAGSGTGSSSASYTVLLNNGPARSGSLTVAGQKFTINQDAAAPVNCTFTLTPSSQSYSSNGGTNTFTINPASASCTWSASTPPGFVNLTTSGSGTGMGTVGYSVAPNMGATRTAAIAVSIQNIVQNFNISQDAAPPVCGVTLPVPGASAPATGTSGSFAVNDGPTCTWTASFSSSWITPTGSTSGTGNGNVGYSVAANTGPARIGTITVNDQKFSITQAAGASSCQFTLNPPSQTVQPGGGPGQVLVITDASCPWTATSNNPDFITVTSGGGTGPSVVNYNVAANPGANARPGSLTIGSVNFPINELGGAAPACNITLSPGSVTAQPAGGPGQVAVTTATGCMWTVSATSWITINAPTSGNGSSTVMFTVQPNTDSNARDGVITIGAQMFMVHQLGGTAPACTYSVNPVSKSAAITGGVDSFSVSASTGCAWTATSNNPDFLTVTTGSGTGNGNGTVNYSLTQNTGTGTRTGTITLQDQTFTVTQPGAGNNPTNPCVFTLSPPSQSAVPGGGPAQVSVGVNTGCAWQAVSNNPDWITVTTGASGSGNGTVFYSVQPNTTGSTRQGSMTIGGVMFPISQPADMSSGNCPLTLNPNSQPAIATGGPGQFMVNTQTGCKWQPISNNPDWITITNAGSGSGSDTVFFNVAANTSANQRMGSITVGSATFNITQAAAGTGTGTGNCSNESIYPASQNAQPAGGTNQVTVTAPTGCTWTAVSNNPDFLTVTNGGSGSGNGMVTYSVATYTGTTPRSGTITIAGQPFMVTQAGAMTSPPCTYSFNPPSQSADGTGGPGETIVSTSTGCAWTATSDSGWLTITTGATGSGSGLVNYSVGPYASGAPRTGNLTLSSSNASNLAQFQVMQSSGSGPACTFTLAPMSQPSTSAGGTGQVAVTVATGCTWSATSNNPDFVTITAGGNGNGSGTLSYSVAANTGAQRMASITIATGVTFSITQDAGSANTGGPTNGGCTYSLSQSTQTAVASGGTSQFSVTTAVGCTWTAVSNNSDFLTVTSGGTGSGGGTVNYSVASNSGANSRTGTITAGGQTFTLMQAGTSGPGGTCSFTLSPPSGSATSDAGSGQVLIIGPTGCPWSAVSNNPDWLTITNGANGNGNGSLTFTVSANTGSARTGSLTIGGVNYPVNQGASGTGNGGNGGGSANCTYTLSSNSQSSKVGGGTGQFSVTTSSGCSWTAVSNDPDWLSVATGATGNGAGTVSYNVMANSGTNSRTGTITVANMTFQVAQDGTSSTNTGCNFSLNPSSQGATAGGGSGQVNVTGTVGCTWTATSANPDWITIVSGGSGNGSGSFTYSVQPNTAPTSRQGMVNVGGLQFTVNQAAVQAPVQGTQPSGGCGFSVNPSQQSATAAGGSGQVNVSASLGCSWTASGNGDWLVVTAGGAGTGNGTVSYSVNANPGAARSGMLTVAGQMVTINQVATGGGGACTYSVTPANQSAASAGGADTINVLAPDGCMWTTVPSADWITITSGGSGNGSGTVNYSAGPNATGAARNANIVIAGTSVAITQSAPGAASDGCTYSLNTTAQQATAGGGTGQVAVSAGAGCAWTASSSVDFITILSGGGGSGNGTLGYSVSANPTGSSRMGTLTIAGQTLTVTQAAAGTSGDTCTYTLNPSAISDPGTGDSGQALVIAPLGCSWLASSNNADWLSVIDSGTGQGNGVVTFGAAANASGASRIGTITIGGQTLTVSQNLPGAGSAPLISVGGIVNGASFAPFNSPSGAIGLGSFFSIFGANLGPTTPAGVLSFPLGTTLAGVSIDVSQGGNHVAAIPHFVSVGQVNAILPSYAPVGAVLVTVTYQGITSNAVAFEVAPNNWGTFTNPAGGVGQGIIQNVVSTTQYDLNMPSNSAQPGQTEIIWGTGLGAINGPDNLPPPVGSLAATVQVLVGGLPATVGYSGRTPCCSAVDNVYFTVPSNAPVGCAVPVQIILNGTNMSNTVTMAIAQNGGQCPQ